MPVPVSGPIPVLCFPFAGAGASAFRRCQEYGSDTVRICPVQLPGREERFGESLHTDVAAAADGLLPEILDQLAGEPYVALFGHSLGAVLAYETAHRIAALGHPEVVKLFVSGSPGPWTRRRIRATGLSDALFLERVREFAGYTHPALEHPELREMLLPPLRADVEMHENYLAPSEKPLAIPVVSVRGAEDELVSRAEAVEWESATTAGCRQVELPGGHMYLVEEPAALVRLLDAELSWQGVAR
ncbi:thioesterase II family protein [Streptomyces sp. NPDC006784]|uniref:thioesterase II family protein n=1 Tax=Streptomyces sp. NPDC006784 TaxID=3364764 RepID=UPI0036B6A81F